MFSKLKRMFRRKKRIKKEAHQRQVEFMKKKYRPEDCTIVIGGVKMDDFAQVNHVSRPRIVPKHPTMEDIRRQGRMNQHIHNMEMDTAITTAAILTYCDTSDSADTRSHDVCDHTDHGSYDCGSSSDSGSWD